MIELKSRGKIGCSNVVESLGLCVRPCLWDVYIRI